MNRDLLEKYIELLLKIEELEIYRDIEFKVVDSLLEKNNWDLSELHSLYIKYKSIIDFKNGLFLENQEGEFSFHSLSYLEYKHKILNLIEINQKLRIYVKNKKTFDIDSSVKECLLNIKENENINERIKELIRIDDDLIINTNRTEISKECFQEMYKYLMIETLYIFELYINDMWDLLIKNSWLYNDKFRKYIEDIAIPSTFKQKNDITNIIIMSVVKFYSIKNNKLIDNIFHQISNYFELFSYFEQGTYYKESLYRKLSLNVEIVKPYIYNICDTLDICFNNEKKYNYYNFLPKEEKIRIIELTNITGINFFEFLKSKDNVNFNEIYENNIKEIMSIYEFRKYLSILEKLNNKKINI